MNIVWTDTAVKQLKNIFSYWNNRNKSRNYSQKLYIAIQERVQVLKSNPKIGVYTNFKNTQALSLKHYSIIYKIEDNTIFITAFWDNRQNPKKLLKFLKSE